MSNPAAAARVDVVEVAAPDEVGEPPVGFGVVRVELLLPVGVEVPVGVAVELPPLLPLYSSTMNLIISGPYF
jgi:hypothetical protein